MLYQCYSARPNQFFGGSFAWAGPRCAPQPMMGGGRCMEQGNFNNSLMFMSNLMQQLECMLARLQAGRQDECPCEPQPSCCPPPQCSPTPACPQPPPDTSTGADGSANCGGGDGASGCGCGDGGCGCGCD